MFKHEDSADESAIIEFDPVDEDVDGTDEDTHESAYDDVRENTHESAYDNVRGSSHENMRDKVRENAHENARENMRDNGHDNMRDSARELTARRKSTRPKVALAATITCPECGSVCRPQWLNKSQHGDSYATTMFCEQCGCLMTVWAMSVDAQVVAHKQMG